MGSGLAHSANHYIKCLGEGEGKPDGSDTKRELFEMVLPKASIFMYGTKFRLGVWKQRAPGAVAALCHT